MSGHTPGPWRARGAVVFGPDINGDPYLVAGSNAFVGAHYSPKRDEAEANARLIAAAPEMYAALKAVVAGIDETVWSSWQTTYKFAPAVELARAAIAKAEGRT